MSLYIDHCGPFERAARERAERLRQALRNPPRPKLQEAPTPPTPIRQPDPPQPKPAPAAVEMPEKEKMTESAIAAAWPIIAVIDDTPSPHPRKFWQIEKAAAAYFGHTLAELRSPRRYLPLVRARQITMYLAKKLTPYSFPAIAKHFGNRDHTTVFHGVRQIETFLDKGNVAVAAAVRDLTEFLEGRAPLAKGNGSTLFTVPVPMPRYWLPREDDWIKEMIAEGTGTRAIADRLARSPQNVRDRMRKLGIPIQKKRIAG